MTEALAKILVADDEPDLRALLQRYLSDQGYSVRTVDGAGPLDVLLQRERFDVLVLDVMMPGEDGLAICRRLRAQGETIPILMLTARGDPVDRIVGLEMGADDYLPKPFNPRELLARIQAMVRRQRLLGAHTGPRQTGGRIDFGLFDTFIEPLLHVDGLFNFVRRTVCIHGGFEQQLFDQLLNVMDVLLKLLFGLLIRQQCQTVAQPRQRRANFMRNVLHQAILLIHQRRDFAGHAIHRPSNWVDCRRVIQLKLGIHLTGADGLGGFAEGAAFFGEQQQDLRREGVDGQPAGQGEQ